MKASDKTIKVLVKNATDKLLLINYLQHLGYTVNDSISDEWSTFGMIISDEFYARIFNNNLLLVKKQPGVIFFPLVIMLPNSANTSSSSWIEYGFDAVLRLPLPKADLAMQLKFLFRLKEQTQSKYELLLENIQLGIYWMNSKNRIMTANTVFANILEYKFRDQIMSQNLMELGVKFQKNRGQFLKILLDAGKVFGYESCWKLKSGKIISVRENANLLEDLETGSFYYIGTVENISTIKY